MVIDTFTRVIHLFPIPDTTAEIAAEVFLHLVCDYGVPVSICSDNGTQFVNAVITELTALLGVTHLTTTAYSSEENGLVERANKEVLRHLRNIIYDRRVMPTWSKHLCLVQRIMNTSYHSSIGMAPAKLLFGESIDLDRGILVPLPTDENATIALSTWITGVIQRQRELTDAARRSLEDHEDSHREVIFADDGTNGDTEVPAKNPSNKHKKGRVGQAMPANIPEAVTVTRREPTVFATGSFVLVDYPEKAPSKLHPVKNGPFKVISHVDNRYELERQHDQQNIFVHVTRLRAYHVSEDHESPQNVQNRDRDMFIIEKITGHRGNLQKDKRSKISFHVLWSSGELTWEPWNPTLPRNAVVIDYLRLHNGASKIAKGYA